MEPSQYEEICRIFISREMNLPIDSIESETIPNSTRPGVAKFSHEIDLLWETGSPLCRYLNIANAKWRGSRKVEQGEVLLLQKVKEEVDANKAFMITNVGFTEGALAVAAHHGIALHIVIPQFDAAVLPNGKLEARLKLAELTSVHGQALYSFRVEHRGLDLSAAGGKLEAQILTTTPRLSNYQNRALHVQMTRIASAHSGSPSIGSTNRGGPPPGSNNREGGGFTTR